RHRQECGRDARPAAAAADSRAGRGAARRRGGAGEDHLTAAAKVVLMSPITTHVLDLSRGRPAAGLAVILERAHGEADWAELARGTTGADGRLTDLLPEAAGIPAGTYRLRFATAPYFAAQGARG